jgi:ferric-dicitrate binding protein FerR (iron transport regulator)
MTKADEDKKREAEAARIMREAGRSETVGTSQLARMAKERPVAEDDPNDPAVIWGRRVGRALGLVALVLLAAYLLAEYGPS